MKATRQAVLLLPGWLAAAGTHTCCRFGRGIVAHRARPYSVAGGSSTHGSEPVAAAALRSNELPVYYSFAGFLWGYGTTKLGPWRPFPFTAVLQPPLGVQGEERRHIGRARHCPLGPERLYRAQCVKRGLDTTAAMR